MVSDRSGTTKPDISCASDIPAVSPLPNPGLAPIVPSWRPRRPPILGIPVLLWQAVKKILTILALTQVNSFKITIWLHCCLLKSFNFHG